MFHCRPHVGAAAHQAIHHLAAVARAHDLGHGRVGTRNARRAPRDELALAAGDDEPGTLGNVGFRPVAQGVGVQVVTLEIDDLFRRHAKEARHAVQAVAFAPLVVNAVHRENVQLLAGAQLVRIIGQGVIITP